MTNNTQRPVCIGSLKLLGDYWTMLIIGELANGPLRFRDLEKRIQNVNSATLTSRLKTMLAAGLIARDELSRADVTYSLTDLGRHALPVLAAVNAFSDYARSSDSVDS
jgi:DNA-binding HxlR family transcriptional regulator